MAPLLLRLNSNLERYEITLYNGCAVCQKRVFTRRESLCVCPQAPLLHIVASPIVVGYSTKLHFWIDTTCQTVVDLYFHFPEDLSPSPSEPLHTFTLTDRNYGLPIDGTLFFDQV